MVHPLQSLRLMVLKNKQRVKFRPWIHQWIPKPLKLHLNLLDLNLAEKFEKATKVSHKLLVVVVLEDLQPEVALEVMVAASQTLLLG